MSLADPQSFNRYSYVNNDPVNFVDPSGLLGILDCRLVNSDPPQYECTLSEFPDPIKHGEPHPGPGTGGKAPQNPALPGPVNNDIANRLKDKDCAKLFGGVDKALQALEALSSIKISFEDLGEYQNVGGTPRGPWVGLEAATRPPGEIVINTRGDSQLVVMLKRMMGCLSVSLRACHTRLINPLSLFMN
jgi:hypothetical protein